MFHHINSHISKNQNHRPPTKSLSKLLTSLTMAACNSCNKRGYIQARATLFYCAEFREFSCDDYFHHITIKSPSHIQPKINVHVSVIGKWDLGKVFVDFPINRVFFVKLTFFVNVSQFIYIHPSLFWWQRETLSYLIIEQAVPSRIMILIFKSKIKKKVGIFCDQICF